MGVNNTNITINKNMSIIGQSQSGTIINGENITGIFSITSDTNVIIQNLTLTNGTGTPFESYKWGGAIFNYYGNLTVKNCTFTSNYPNVGGAIYNMGGNCTVSGSTFTDNHSMYGGGAIENGYYGNLTVSESTFNSNTANTGGAIWSYGHCTVHFNRIVGNTAEWGNAICHGTGFLNATDNWWGSNNPDFSSLIVGASAPSQWLFMTINAAPSTINNTQTSLITVSFNNCYNGTIVTPLDPATGHIPDGTPVEFSLTNGPFGTLTAPLTANTINGVASIIFTASNVGVQDVNGTLDDQNVTTNITIKPSAHFNLDTFYADYNEFINNNHNIVKITNPVNYLDQVIVVFTATNMGPDPVTSLELREDWPSELISTGNYWHTFDGINWIPGSFFAQGSFNLYPTYAGPLNMGDVCWVVFGATVNASNTFITNTVTTIEQIPVDAQGYDSASADLQVSPVANLVIIKSGPSTIIAGNQITYTITAINNGPDSATNVVISDIFPWGISNVSWNAEYFGGASGPTSGTGDININLGTLPAGGSCIITVNGTVLSSTPAATILSNTATITTSTHITDPANTTDSVSTTVTRESSIEISKTADNKQPNVGDTVTFTVTAHNNGPSDADNIQILDIMPSDFTNVIITPSLGTYNIETGIWTLNLTNGESATLNLTGKVTSTMAGKNTTNTAYYGLNLANATIYVPKSDLYLKITGNNNNPTVGQTFTVTYKLGNNGPDNATNVVMTIPLPDGFVVSSISGDGNWTITGNTITWTLTNVPKGDPYLYVAGWLNHAGNFIFSSSITSDTYNINTTGITPLTINAVNAASATSTTRTIGMQETGIPIAGLILAILAVLGGLITPKRK